MNGCCIALLFLLLCGWNQRNDIPGCPDGRSGCPGRDDASDDRNCRNEEKPYLCGNKTFNPFSTPCTCGCEEKDQS